MALYFLKLLQQKNAKMQQKIVLTTKHRMFRARNLYTCAAGLVMQLQEV